MQHPRVRKSGLKTKAKKRGGARLGAGRKPATDPKVKIWFSVKASKSAQARALIEPIISQLNE